MSNKDGGPAFPHRWQPGMAENAPTEGMTLRDWFAGHAPIAPLSPFVQDYETAGSDAWHMIKARWAYADAMIAERAKG